ncbi:MAG: homocysteine S-methyltransferase family protein [Oscillospiraceae bacterium]|jgi:5-methyltetrahydrofolate--homocysteine methyltransferase|nr:homocysteine S-methyltransferase family protein [Oscillospiraceae bacterium]
MAILLDGAMGTQLMGKIGALGKYPETISTSHPQVVKDIHKAYAEAGARIITSHTLTLSPSRAKDGGYDLRRTLSRALINAAYAALPVALDIGPLGKMLEPYGDLPIDEAYNEFLTVIKLGAEIADYILIETLSDINEADIAIRAALDGCEKPIFITMSFNPDGTSLMGCSAEQFAARADALGVNALGFNCNVNPLEGHTIFERLQSATDLPLIVQPNQLDDPDEWADAMMWYAERGAGYVGGCCGTTPAHIKALADRLPKE